MPQDNAQSIKIDNRDSMTKTNSISQKLHEQLSIEQRKNIELERQLRRMTMERDILKKALAYCLDVPN